MGPVINSSDSVYRDNDRFAKVYLAASSVAIVASAIACVAATTFAILAAPILLPLSAALFVIGLAGIGISAWLFSKNASRSSMDLLFLNYQLASLNARDLRRGGSVVHC